MRDVRNRLYFELQATNSGSSARAGVLRTRRGPVETPVFMPVGTRATVRGVQFDALEAAGTRIMLANTYHLLLQPGPEVLASSGGIHGFTGWSMPVLTDSGGYQVFSLSDAASVADDGVRFNHPLTGKEVMLTPRLSIETQRCIGADIMMAFDECVPATADFETALSATERTFEWAKQCIDERGDSDAALFGIVQGACHESLRRKSASEICSLPFDGFAIGGLAVGEEKRQREDFCELTAALLPQNKPRYLMGVGTPIDLLEAVHRGVDMFDCIIPTERAQQGFAFTFNGKKRLTRGSYRMSGVPIDTACGCPACRHSERYLHHLFKAREPLGPILLSLHNIHFYHTLMRRIRIAITENNFASFYNEYRTRLSSSDGRGGAPSSRRRRKKPPQTRRGAFEIYRSEMGHHSIRHVESGEIMHSVNPPDEEAHCLYVGPSRLVERLTHAKDALILWDVGLGAAHNAMAALRRAETTPQKRALEIISFETDLDALRLALANHTRFPHLDHSAPRALLKTGVWHSDAHPIRWRLVSGDFCDTMTPCDSPDIVFFDPFSAKTDTSLWTLATFENLFEKCGAKACTLHTYSTATSVRAALLAAGFFVAEGVSSGPKESTTVAATPLFVESVAASSFQWLNRSWLERFERSGKRYPAGSAVREEALILDNVMTHQQFK